MGMVEVDILLLVILFIYLVIATISDVKTREVPDWINFSLLSIALGIRFLFSLMNNQWSYFAYGLLGFLACFVFGEIMYYSKQWGGGDSKLLRGLGACIPIYPAFLLSYFTPNLNWPFLAILLMNILIVGGFYGIFLSIILAVKHKERFVKELKHLLKKHEYKLEVKVSMISIIFLVFLSFILKDIFRFVTISLMVFILVVMTLFILIKAVENSAMYKEISINKLTEGDWVLPFKSKGKIIKFSYLGISKRDIATLKKLRIRKVLVKEGLPFLPVFLIGLIVTLIFGNLLPF